MTRWKEALWDWLDVFSVRRLTARVTLSAGLLGLASSSAAEAGTQPRVPVSPALMPEASVRKFNGRYILRRNANAFFIHLAGHRSHSSHSSHRSHSSHVSHSSGSHYSGSHFSSSPTVPSPPRAPSLPPVETPTPRAVAEVPAAPPPPVRLLDEDFSSDAALGRWKVGVLATPQATFDPRIETERSNGALRIAPLRVTDGAHYSGYLSQQSFNLEINTISVQLQRAASGGAVTLFAAGIDDRNWFGFRIAGGKLSFESHSAGRVAAKSTPYNARDHRYLRLRRSDVAPTVVWESSTDGRTWNVEHVETPSISVRSLRIALSAGTDDAVSIPGSALFDNVVVEQKR